MYDRSSNRRWKDSHSPVNSILRTKRWRATSVAATIISSSSRRGRKMFRGIRGQINSVCVLLLCDPPIDFARGERCSTSEQCGFYLRSEEKMREKLDSIKLLASSSSGRSDSHSARTSATPTSDRTHLRRIPPNRHLGSDLEETIATTVHSSLLPPKVWMASQNRCVPEQEKSKIGNRRV